MQNAKNGRQADRPKKLVAGRQRLTSDLRKALSLLSEQLTTHDAEELTTTSMVTGPGQPLRAASYCVFQRCVLQLTT